MFSGGTEKQHWAVMGYLSKLTVRLNKVTDFCMFYEKLQNLYGFKPFDFMFYCDTAPHIFLPKT